MLILIAILLAISVIVGVIIIFTPNDYKQCYEERKSYGSACFGKCRGLVGGTKGTNRLLKMCMNCPYLYSKSDNKKGIDNGV